MTRNSAARLARELFAKYGLQDWHLRFNTTDLTILGMCSHKDKCIILSAHHCDTHPDAEIENTIRHEIAHALTPGHQHNDVWRAKAIEVGCTSFQPCSHLSFSAEAIDAIRSGATLEVEVEVEVIPEQIIHKPKYKVTRLQDRCEHCGKVAVIKNEITLPEKDPFKPDVKLIFLECGHAIRKLLPKATPFETLKSDDGKSPYPYQVEGMKFGEAALATGNGVLFADEMGLGKTIEAIGTCLFDEVKFPVLCLVKSGTKYQWFREWLRWSHDKCVAQVIQTSQDFVIPNLKVYIASHDIFTPKTRVVKGKTINQGFDRKKFDFIKTVIIDECQGIKNPDSSRTQQIRQLVAGKQVIGMSGTPWKNRGSEYFSILNMIAPKKFSSYQGFLDRWVDIYMHGNRTKVGGIRNVKEFKEYVKDFVIRRERSEVMPDLPKVNRMMYYCEADKHEKEVLDENEKKFVEWYKRVMIGGEEDSQETQMNLMAKLVEMRRLTGLAKVKHTIDWVGEFVSETERKLVIFVHHIDVGKALVEELNKQHGQDMPVLALTGSMTSPDRMAVQDKFNQAPRALLIASTLAAGEGLNLQTCADCIMHERQWNPANEEQAEGRFIRIGQESDKVNATYMTIAGSVDEHLGALVEEKRTNFHAAMNNTEMIAWNQGSLMKELAEKIVKNHMRKR